MLGKYLQIINLEFGASIAIIWYTVTIAVVIVRCDDLLIHHLRFFGKDFWLVSQAIFILLSSHFQRSPS